MLDIYVLYLSNVRRAQTHTHTNTHSYAPFIGTAAALPNAAIRCVYQHQFAYKLIYMVSTSRACLCVCVFVSALYIISSGCVHVFARIILSFSRFACAIYRHGCASKREQMPERHTRDDSTSQRWYRSQRVNSVAIER